MTQQKGFTIIEWLIYFFLIISVLTGIFHFAASVQQKFFTLGKRSGMLAQLCAAQDAIAHDLDSAPVEVKHWEFIGPNSIAWKHEKKKVSWSLNENILCRTEKGFNSTLKKWKTKKTSVIARAVSELHFAPCFVQLSNGQKNIQSVTCILEQSIGGKKQRAERTIVLKNRVVW